MPFYDLTVPITEGMPTYPGDPGIQIRDWFSLAKGDAANVSLLHFGAHTGTHIDAPAHFIEGANKIASLPLEVLIGEALVIELPGDEKVIDEAFIAERCSPGTLRVIFKTRNSSFWHEPKSSFRSDYTYLSTAGANKLVSLGVRLVGIDYLSIEKFEQQSHETHLSLLSHGMIIIEGLDLTGVTPGNYELICLPLRICAGHGDGAPARVVLRTID